MSTDEKAAKHEAAAEVWRLLFGFFLTTRTSRDTILQKLKLTPVDAKALDALSADEGKPMRVLAESWSCDASNATWMVDRLEQRGLAERQASPTDRRVKLVALTKKGTETKMRLMAALLEPPDELFELSLEDLQRLRDGLTQLLRSERLESFATRS